MANWWESAPMASPLDIGLHQEGITGPLADIARSVYHQESSSGRNTTTSNAGAVGGMQILPGTFAEVADEGWDINDPIQNARAGIRYLNKMYELGGNDPRLAAIGYYGGPGAIQAAKAGQSRSDPRNPQAPDTFQYADQVLARIPREPGLIERAVNAVVPAAQAETVPAGNWWEQAELVSPAPQAGQGEKWWEAAPLVEGDRSNVETYSDGQGDSVRLVYDAPRELPEEQPQAEPQERSTLDSIGRQLGLTARAGLTGVSAIPEMLVNPLFRMAGLPEMRLSNTLDAIGLPQPENATERVSQDVAGAMAGAGGIGGAGRLLERAAAPLAKGIGSMLTPRAGTQVASAALGSGAASTGRESGASEGTQLALGLGGALAPSLIPYAGNALFRYAMRGGEQSRQAMQDRIQQFRLATGETPTYGQASGRRIVQGAENMATKTLGSSGVMTRKIESQIQGLQNKVDDIAASLSPAGGPVEAGESIARGLEGFKQGFKRMQGQLYGALDDYLPNDTPIAVSRTADALRRLNSDIEGAPALSRMFKNARIQGIERALRSDLGDEATALPYEAIKKLRTLVGEELADSSFMGDVPRSKWRALYAALSDDLGEAAAAAGPEAQGAWRWANSFTRQQMQRLDDLAVVMNKDGPEKIFRAAISGVDDGNTVIERVMNALPKENRKDMAAAVIRRMGRATPGNQNDLGDVFSVNTFLTNWNRMSPEAKKTLFGRLGVDGVEDALKSVAGAANVMKESATAMANPSGTAAHAVLAGQVGGGAVAAMMGNYLPAAASLIAAPAAAYGIARYLTSPSRINRLAEQVLMSPAARPSAINQLFQFTQEGE